MDISSLINETRENDKELSLFINGININMGIEHDRIINIYFLHIIMCQI